MIPGLIDAHNHLQMTGRVLDQVQLFDCRSIGEIVERVAARCQTLPPGTWVLGRGWDESLLHERRHPTRHDLDAVSPEHPVLLERVWNKLVCNGAALRAAGVDRDTPDPAGTLYAGSFERDGDGHPTGLFRDRAKELIWSCIPEPTEVDWVTAVETACREYNRVGLTAVCEPGLSPAADPRRTSRRSAQGQLSVRVDMMMAGWGFGTGGARGGAARAARAGRRADRLRRRLAPAGRRQAAAGRRHRRPHRADLRAVPGRARQPRHVGDRPGRAAGDRPLLPRPRLGDRHAHVRRRGPGGDGRGVRGGAGREPAAVAAAPRAPRLLPDRRGRWS